MSNLYNLQITDANTGVPVTAFTFSSSTTSDMTSWIIAPLDYQEKLDEIERVYNSKQSDYENKCNLALTKVTSVKLCASDIINVLNDEDDEEKQELRQEIVNILNDDDSLIDDYINSALSKADIIIDADTLENNSYSQINDDFVSNNKLRWILQNLNINYGNGEIVFTLPECTDVGSDDELNDCPEN